jgi:hypothetical protein
MSKQLAMKEPSDTYIHIYVFRYKVNIKILRGGTLRCLFMEI